MTTILVIAFFILLLSHLQLRERVSDLEKNRVKKTPPENVAEVKISPIPRPEFSGVAIPPLAKTFADADFSPVIATEHTDQVVKEEVPTEFILVTWFKEHTLIKLGGLFLFLGAAWFVSYAIIQGWLSPELRIVLGFALAVITYVLAWYRAKVETTQYVVLTAVGTGIVCATVTAAQIVFDQMFSPMFALFVLALSIGYTVFVAWETRVTWLTLLAGIAGLMVPLLIDSTSEPLWLLLYLLVLASGLIFVGLKMEVRLLTLLMVVGVINYETILLANKVSEQMLWFFVVIFSAIFFASITKSLATSIKPTAIDIVTFGIVCLSYVSFASEIALSKSLAVFIATFIIGATGYLLAQRNVPLMTISVFIAAAGAGVLIGTSFLFSGFTLVLAYSIEITAAFLAATYLGLPGIVIWTVAATYLLPIIGSLSSFVSDNWRDGVWHPDALVLYTVGASLLGSQLWLIHQPTVSIYRWSKTLATIFGVTGFFYVYGVIAVVTDSLFPASEAVIAMYALWAVLSLAYIYYSLKQKFPVDIAVYSTLTLLIPLLVSLQSFSVEAWSNGVNHPDGIGVLSILLILFLTTLIVTQHFCKEYDAVLRKLVGSLVITTVAYLFIFFYVFWHGILTPFALAEVAVYSSYAWVLYGLTSLFVLLRANINWIGISISALALPVFMSLDSFSFSGWEEGVLSPDAVGLFSLILIFVLLALGLRKHYESEKNADEKTVMAWSRLLFGLAFVYAVGLVWVISHTVVAGAQAVSIALFVYTVCGLFAYRYGKYQKNKDIKYAGTSLLTIVVLHLLLIDFKSMEVIWKVITFLGIGVLFIATALLDKDKS